MIRKFYRWLMPAVHSGYPLHRFNERAPTIDYHGLVVTSDIDATYLHTEVKSIRGLVRAALETAEEKRTIPGMVPLLRSFRHGPHRITRGTFLYFVSASPPQMQKVISQKMRLDRVDADGITLKDPLRLIRRGRWEQIRHHILYKLTALLLNRCDRPSTSGIEEVLLGDDSETDAEAYLLYAKILAQELNEQDICQTLDGLGATPREKDNLLLLTQRTDQSQVKRIYIHRTFGRPLSSMPEHDPKLMLAAHDSFQIAVDAFLNGWIREETIPDVAMELHVSTLTDSLVDAKQRQLFSDDTIARLLELLSERGIQLTLPPISAQLKTNAETLSSEPQATSANTTEATNNPIDEQDKSSS